MPQKYQTSLFAAVPFNHKRACEQNTHLYTLVEWVGATSVSTVFGGGMATVVMTDNSRCVCVHFVLWGEYNRKHSDSLQWSTQWKKRAAQKCMCMRSIAFISDANHEYSSWLEQVGVSHTSLLPFILLSYDLFCYIAGWRHRTGRAESTQSIMNSISQHIQ